MRRSAVPWSHARAAARMAAARKRGSAVVDPQAAVTDTHPLIFFAAGGGRLGDRAARVFARCERREAILYVPAVVMWECTLLARAARINLRRSVRAFFDDLVSNPSYQTLDLATAHVVSSYEQ